MGTSIVLTNKLFFQHAPQSQLHAHSGFPTIGVQLIFSVYFVIAAHLHAVFNKNVNMEILWQGTAH